MYQFSPANPFRVPSWRWQRASQIVSGEVRWSRRRDDNFTRQAMQLKRRLDACEHPREFSRIFDTMPEIYVAYDIYRRDDPQEAALKWELEARLLTDMDPYQTAQMMGLLPEAVELYTRLFFDVREKLGIRSYIIHQVIGPSVSRGITARETDLLWKLFGYFGGPSILDEVIGATRDMYKPENQTENTNFWTDTVLHDLRRKAAIAVKTMSVTSLNQAQILELFMKLVEIERQSEGGQNTEESLMANIQLAMQSFVFSVGKPALSDVADAAYDGVGREPRTHEVLARAVGVEARVATFERLLPQPSYPAAPEPIGRPSE